MPYHFAIKPHTLYFKQPAGTSRGIYTERKVWYIEVSHSDFPHRIGIGECAPLPHLSIDYSNNYIQELEEVCRSISIEYGEPIPYEKLCTKPSMLMGIETAIRHFEAKSWSLWHSSFAQGKVGIPINGLIWMGDYNTMLQRIEEKIAAGFRCLKLKIGAIDFAQELALLKHIRSRFSPESLEIRLDANGAFLPDDALTKLQQLAPWHIHSIEQPIAAHNWQAMARIVEQSPLPIALDEELIGISSIEKKVQLLNTINPHYIILKPSLHGGFAGSQEWINLAQKAGISWWITSALESNIGLNALAHWCGSMDCSLSQGLGTGQLFRENCPPYLSIKEAKLWAAPV